MDAVDGQAVTCLFRLPVSGHVVALRHPNGAEDLLLLEAAGEDTLQALALVSRLARPATDIGIDWLELTVTDLDALILRLRQMVIGDRIRADVACRASGCGQRIDISFGITDYAGHRKPAKPGARGASTVAPVEEPGWFRLTSRRKKTGMLAPSAKPPADDSAVSLGSGDSSNAVVFRLPTVADQLAVVGRERKSSWIHHYCHRQLRRPEFPRPDHRGVGAVTPPLGFIAARYATQAHGEAGVIIAATLAHNCLVL